MNKKRTVKNLITLNLSVFLTVAAYLGLFNLQSTINAEGQIGTSTLVLIHAVLTVSSVLLPNVFIKKFGCKVTVFLGILGYVPFVVANLYPVWSILIPAATLCGVGASLFCISRSTYMNDLSTIYSSFTNYPEHATRTIFFGIVSVAYSTAQVFGSAISYGILKPQTEYNNSTSVNVTCGVHFCNEDISTTINSNLTPPSDEKRYLLTAVYALFLVVAGLVVLLGLDSSPIPSKEDGTISLFFDTFETMRLLRNPKLLLLLPLTFYAGLIDGFIISEFSKAYIGCALGIHKVGLVMIAYGVCCGLTSTVCGTLLNYFGLPWVFLSAAVCNFITLVSFLLWIPNGDSFVAMFSLTAALGCADGVWWSSIPALFGVLFKESQTPAFANFYVWSSVGLLVAYALEGILCTHVQIFIIMANLLLGMLGYSAIELWIRQESRSHKPRNRYKEQKLSTVGDRFECG